MARGQSLQDPFLNALRKERIPVSIYLVNGIKLQGQIDSFDHFVVLYMENHAADNFFGCMDLPGFDGIKGHKLPKDPSDPSKGTFEVTCGKADYVCKGGPGYDTFAGKFPKTGAMPHIYPYSEQSDVNPALHGATEGGVATTMYGPEQVRKEWPL